VGFTRREWESRFGDSPDNEFDDRPTFVIVRDPTNAAYWSQGEFKNDQYFTGMRRSYSLSIDGEYVHCGIPYPQWSSRWEDASTYDSLESATRMLRRIGREEP